MARLGKFFYINGTDNLSNAHFLRVRADGGITESLGCIDTAGTLLESASYFMRPSGYKEDTVYSLIPNNSNGSLSFTRASDAWRTEIGGLVQRTPWNLLPQSEDFTTVVWGKLGGTTVTANQATAPNGTNTADLITEGTSVLLYYTTLTPAGTYTQSWYLKKGTGDVAVIYFGSAYSARYNLTLGTIVSTNNATATITDVGNGWYRCTATATPTASFYAGLNYSNSSGLTIYAWGAQLVEGVDQLPYFPTTDRLNVPRLDYTYGTCPALLLEPQRTNLGTNSQNFADASWAVLGATKVATNLTDPSNTNTACNVTWPSGGGKIFYGTRSSSPGTYTISFYVKSSNGSKFRLYDGVSTSISSDFTATSTFQRFSYTFTQSAGTGGFYGILSASDGSAADIVVAFAQFEAGSYSTTYIPTTTASATRIADFATTSTSLQSAGILGSVGNTAFYNVTIPQNTNRSGQFCATLTSGSVATNSLGLVLNTASIQVRSWFGGTGQLNYTLATNPTTLKIALSYVKSTKTIKIFVNGSLATTVSSIDFADYTQLTLHDLNSNTQTTSLFYHQIALFNSALSDSDCIALTT